MSHVKSKESVLIWARIEKRTFELLEKFCKNSGFVKSIEYVYE